MYADDSAIVSLLQGNENGHGPNVDSFVKWQSNDNWTHKEQNT